MSRVLSSADHGREIAVAAGDEIVIELAERATAGYAWTVVSAPSGVDVSVERPNMAAGAIGSDATVRVVARVRSTSGGVLELVHQQAWSPSPLDPRFRITLTRT